MKVECHCGNITLEAAEPDELTSCNCSICRRYQALWAYYSPAEVHVCTGGSGEEVYIWGDKELEFVRCANCGCVTHYRTVEGQADPILAINFRLADSQQIEALPKRYFNGAELL